MMKTKAGMLRVKVLALIALWVGLNAAGQTEDWPMWGRDATRNMVSPERGLPADFDPGKFKPGTEEVDLSTARNVKWAAKLGSQSYGNPTVAGGRVFVGTNNESPRDPGVVGDRGVVIAFDEKTGQFLWQLVVPKLGSGKVSDWEFLGICSSPAIDGDRVFVVTNRCEVVCLDVQGMANGNDGPYQDEAQYKAGPGNPPAPIGPADADILWVFDMRDQLGVFPHNISSNSVLIVGDSLFLATSNGMDWTHTNIPYPNAPALVKLNKNTGEYLGEEGSGISKRMFHCNWSSPAYAQVNGRPMLFFCGGDGFAYGFNPEAQPSPESTEANKILILPEIWRYDCNPPEHKMKDGKPIKYPDPDGPSEIIATPVFHNNRIHVAVGQDPEHGDGVGNLSCIDVTGSGDISRTGKVWEYRGIRRTMSTASIADGLLFICDYAGRLHCLEADTGKPLWVHDTGSHIWGSTLVADGKVYFGNESGELTIMAAAREEKLIGKVRFPAPIYSTPIAANGLLYIGTQTHLYAIGGGQAGIAGGAP